MLFIRRLIWDDWNVAHIVRHGVTQEEAEEVCYGLNVVREAYKGRAMLIGPTKAGRMLAVILEPTEREAYYPVTARPASRKERRLFRQLQEGSNQ